MSKPLSWYESKLWLLGRHMEKLESNLTGCADTCARLHKEVEKLRQELAKAHVALDGAIQINNDHLRQEDKHISEITQLRDELERERTRLAACGVVANANTKETADEARSIHLDYQSDSLSAVIGAVDREMNLRGLLRECVPHIHANVGAWISESKYMPGTGKLIASSLVAQQKAKDGELLLERINTKLN